MEIQIALLDSLRLLILTQEMYGGDEVDFRQITSVLNKILLELNQSQKKDVADDEPKLSHVADEPGPPELYPQRIPLPLTSLPEPKPKEHNKPRNTALEVIHLKPPHVMVLRDRAPSVRLCDRDATRCITEDIAQILLSLTTDEGDNL